MYIYKASAYDELLSSGSIIYVNTESKTFGSLIVLRHLLYWHFLELIQEHSMSLNKAVPQLPT